MASFFASHVAAAPCPESRAGSSRAPYDTTRIHSGLSVFSGPLSEKMGKKTQIQVLISSVFSIFLISVAHTTAERL